MSTENDLEELEGTISNSENNFSSILIGNENFDFVRLGNTLLFGRPVQKEPTNVNVVNDDTLGSIEIDTIEVISDENGSLQFSTNATITKNNGKWKIE